MYTHLHRHKHTLVHTLKHPPTHTHTHTHNVHNLTTHMQTCIHAHNTHTNKQMHAHKYQEWDLSDRVTDMFVNWIRPYRLQPSTLPTPCCCLRRSVVVCHTTWGRRQHQRGRAIGPRLKVWPHRSRKSGVWWNNVHAVQNIYFFTSQVCCPSGISPKENLDCFHWGKPAVTELRYGACWVF